MVDYGNSLMVDYGNYPTGTTVGTQTSGMSPEMEAKFLWYLDQVVNKMKDPYGGQGPVAAQTVVGMTDAQKQAIDSATDPEGWKKYLNEYQGYVTQGITDQFDQSINQANMGAAVRCFWRSKARNYARCYGRRKRKSCW